MSDPENPFVVLQEQQADDALWVEASETATEAYLRRALKRIHAAIEGEPWPPEHK